MEILIGCIFIICCVLFTITVIVHNNNIEDRLDKLIKLLKDKEKK